jgi:hypothetical protein
VNASDVRVIQAGQQLRFTLESSQPLGIVGIDVWQDLQRDVATQASIVRTVDLAHAAASDQRIDTIRTEDRTRRQPCTRFHRAIRRVPQWSIEWSFSRILCQQRLDLLPQSRIIPTLRLEKVVALGLGPRFGCLMDRDQTFPLIRRQRSLPLHVRQPSPG